MAIEPGTKIGPYEIISTLPGVNGGTAYKAADTRSKRIVTLHLLALPVSQKPEVKQRMERDSRTISSLNHPAISAPFEMGSHDGVDYVAAEFVEGETLAQRLSRGAMEIDDALKVGIAIAEALDKAHRGGVIHGGLNPSNVMLTTS